MAQRIIWTTQAKKIFHQILDFYNQINGSKTYSRKLNTEIKKNTLLLLQHPYLGRLTEIEYLRVIVLENHHIYYQINDKNDEIEIILVWDCRQDPQKLLEFISKE